MCDVRWDVDDVPGSDRKLLSSLDRGSEDLLKRCILLLVDDLSANLNRASSARDDPDICLITVLFGGRCLRVGDGHEEHAVRRNIEYGLVLSPRGLDAFHEGLRRRVQFARRKPQYCVGLNGRQLSGKSSRQQDQQRHSVSSHGISPCDGVVRKTFSRGSPAILAQNVPDPSKTEPLAAEDRPQHTLSQQIKLMDVLDNERPIHRSDALETLGVVVHDEESRASGPEPMEAKVGRPSLRKVVVLDQTLHKDRRCQVVGS